MSDSVNKNIAGIITALAVLAGGLLAFSTNHSNGMENAKLTFVTEQKCDDRNIYVQTAKELGTALVVDISDKDTINELIEYIEGVEGNSIDRFDSVQMYSYELNPNYFIVLYDESGCEIGTLMYPREVLDKFLVTKNLKNN